MDEERYIQTIISARRLILNTTPNDLQRRLILSYLSQIEDIIRNIDSMESETVIKQLRKALSRWYGSFDGQVNKAILDSLTRLEKVFSVSTGRLIQDTGLQIKYSFAGMKTDAYQAMFAKRDLDLTNSYKTIRNRSASQSVVNGIDDILRDSVRGSISWQDTTEKIKNALMFDNSDLQKAFKAARAGEIKTTPEMRKLLFDSRRIAQTEIDSALHEGEAQASIRNPVVKALKWQTSGRHDGLYSSPDICDVFEMQDIYGLGEGVYFAENIPAKPHPFCGCTRQYVLRKPNEWNQPKQNPNPPSNVSSSSVSQTLNSSRRKGNRNITDNHIQRTTEQVNTLTTIANNYSKAQERTGT